MFATAAPSGAYGANVAFDRGSTQRWFIEEQRWGRDLVIAGIATDDTATIDRGLLMLKWGFDHQNADGSFNCPDTFHSTSFFVDAAGQALLMLELSPYAQRYATQSAAMLPRLHLAALWMIRPDVVKTAFSGPIAETPFTHRRFLVAAGLGETALLTHDATLAAAAEASARAGIAMQDASGYNPEKGGYDSSYHAVGVVFAQRYYTVAAPDSLRPALYASIGHAVDWAASRLTPDGRMILTGNTRVNGLPENDRTGAPKQPSYRGTFRLLYRWGQLSGQPAYMATADRVAKVTPASSMPAFLADKPAGK